MSNVLIRDVPADDLELIRSAAYLRRQDALARMAQRLQAKPVVPDDEREAVLDAIDEAHEQRADQLSEPPSR